jgi:uncharacterized Zn-binding protein involved in type VI secretion
MSRPVARYPVDKITTGHGCSSTATIMGAMQGMVYANNLPVSTLGDEIAPHFIKVGRTCIPHGTAKVNAGSAVVFAFGRPVSRIGDSADAGVITSGSPMVFAGG